MKKTRWIWKGRNEDEKKITVEIKATLKNSKASIVIRMMVLRKLGGKGREGLKRGDQSVWQYGPRTEKRLACKF